MSSGKSLQLLCILPFGMFCLSAISMFVKILLAVCMLVGMVVAVSVCMSGTRGSGVLSSTGDMLVRGVGGVCDMCMCLARVVWVESG